MRERNLVFCFLLLSALLTPAVADEGHSHGIAGKVGTVIFPVSCAPAVQKTFPHAVALLHSFEYDSARAEFTQLAGQDPKCGMAWWGVAMTQWHPLWYPPRPAEFQPGREAIEKAVSVGAKTARERGFINALAKFYGDADQLDHTSRVLAYQKAMEELHQRYPRDTEIAAFYALSLLEVSLPPDKEYRRQLKAANIMEGIFSKYPEHPGAAHYIIHSFDFPALAPQAVKAAHAYAKIAPAAPHALHMPSHIFTRLGMWQDSIDSNIASRDAARKLADSGSMAGAREQQLHAMDYLMYAYLQMGRDGEAKNVLDETLTIQEDHPSLTGDFAAAAIPARYVTERRQWAEARELKLPAKGQPAATAILHWARGLGAARTGELTTARQELQTLEEIRDQLRKNQVGYDWATQVEVQRLSLASWIERASGDDEEALRLARSAADLEDSTDKHAVTPGSVLPAREMLGDLLLELKQPAEALAAYETSLKSAPRRFNSLYGAAHAAELAGDHQKANEYYSVLLENCSKADCKRPEFERAKTFIAKK